MRGIMTLTAVWLTLVGGVDADAESLRQKCIADTVYHAVVNTHDATLNVSYGPFLLVSCDWISAAGKMQSPELSDTLISEPGIVRGRSVWHWEEAIPARLVRVVAGATTATPEQVGRIIPHRFEVALSNGQTLCIMTRTGRDAPRLFAEKWRRWLGWISTDIAAGRIEMIVTPEDAQTLYYALEKGTPVFVE